MSKKVVRICDACNKECKGYVWSGVGLFGERYRAFNYIGYRLKVRAKQNVRLYSYVSGGWKRYEICNECADEMFKWLMSKKMGVDK